MTNHQTSRPQKTSGSSTKKT